METHKDTCEEDSIPEKTNPYQQLDQDEEDKEEVEKEEDALSFCDLPMHNHTSKEDQSFSSSSLSSSNQDLFEFFTQDWTNSNSNTNYPLPYIVFCGKLIPFKEPISHPPTNPETNKKQKPQNGGFFRWNLRIFSRKSGHAKKNNVAKSRCKYGFSVRRVSIVAWPAKPWWRLLMFGLARIPAAEMEMRGIRSRQSRRSPSAMFRLSNSGGVEEVRRVEGLWGLIRWFGCGGSQCTAMQAQS